MRTWVLVHLAGVLVLLVRLLRLGLVVGLRLHRPLFRVVGLLLHRLPGHPTGRAHRGRAEQPAGSVGRLTEEASGRLAEEATGGIGRLAKGVAGRVLLGRQLLWLPPPAPFGPPAPASG